MLPQPFKFEFWRILQCYVYYLRSAFGSPCVVILNTMMCQCMYADRDVTWQRRHDGGVIMMFRDAWGGGE